MVQLQDSFTSSPILLIAVVVLVAYVIYPAVTDPLRKVPGPWLARFTRFWELQHILASHFEQVNIDLHDRYGPVVRIAPNRYSFSCPSVVQNVYGHGTKFYKDRWYRAFGHPDDAQADMFSIIDERRHAINRRKVASMFSMTTLMAYEPTLDACIMTLVGRLAEFAAKAESVDIPTWMQYYAFDAIGEITFGKPFGMMDKSGDTDGILSTIHKSLIYSSRVSLFNELHSWIAFASHVLGLRRAFENVNAYVSRQLKECRDPDSDRPDFVHKLLQLQRGGKVDEMDIFNVINANIAAGSDTTGLTLSAVVYYLAHNPRSVQKLRTEIDIRSSEGRISDPVTFTEAQQMPYLQAIIKETLRVHPAVGQPLARVVPPGGATLNNYFFPAGTVVGTNAWVLHRDKDVFGDDADAFRPERWLGLKEDIAPLERNLFSFGAGPRTCIGKNISLLEMTKLIPQLYRRFDFELEGDKWETQSAFFVKSRFKCKVVCRKILEKKSF